jgi:hypothetical protein
MTALQGQTMKTIGIIAFLACIVVVGLFRVLRDLLERDLHGSPSLPGNGADLRDEPAAGIPKSAIADTATSNLSG